MDPDKQDVTAEERLQEIKTEEKALRGQIAQNKRDRKLELGDRRIKRENLIKERQIILTAILKKIFQYNKLGKIAKSKIDILQEILQEINLKED